jgi:membrane fusion protein, multidrug efflux system
MNFEFQPLKAAASFRVKMYRIAILFCLASIPAACSKKGDQKAVSARPPVPVTVAQAFQTNVPVEIFSVGNVQPVSLVTVRPQVTGKIKQVHFTEGQDVNAGDLLITLDASSWEAAVNQARANLKRDEAQLFSARLEFQRASNLFASRIASEQDFQTAEAAYLAAESTAHADAAAVSNAMVNLSYTELRAPIDGRTGTLAVKAGNVVKAPDDAVVTITTLRPAEVAFGVPEQHLLAIRRRSGSRVCPWRRERGCARRAHFYR